jgi:hypothetical protein
LGSNGYGPGQEHALVSDAGEPVRLSTDQDLSLTYLFRYRIVRAEGERGPWRVTTAAYYHALEDGASREIIAYHWHPGQGSAFDFPHLHMGVGIGASLGEVHKHHIPTERIAFEDVLRFAVRDLGARPARDDWEEILDETQAAFEVWRTWHGSGP